jgi:hypothetical protein
MIFKRDVLSECAVNLNVVNQGVHLLENQIDFSVFNLTAFVVFF